MPDFTHQCTRAIKMVIQRLGAQLEKKDNVVKTTMQRWRARPPLARLCVHDLAVIKTIILSCVHCATQLALTRPRCFIAFYIERVLPGFTTFHFNQYPN